LPYREADIKSGLSRHHDIENREIDGIGADLLQGLLSSVARMTW